MSSILPLAADAKVVTGDFTPWVILFLPLAAAFVIGLTPPIRRSPILGPVIAIGAVVAGLAITLFKYFLPSLDHGAPVYEGIVDWIRSGSVFITFGTRLDALALTMTLVVTGVGSAIFIYALGYMKGDDAIGRFYAKFSLFVFSMLGIVLSPNFFQTFVFWEPSSSSRMTAASICQSRKPSGSLPYSRIDAKNTRQKYVYSDSSRSAMLCESSSPERSASWSGRPSATPRASRASTASARSTSR